MKASQALSACNCFAVRQAARQITRFYGRRLAATGLTAAQFSILAALRAEGQMTMAALAKAMVMDRTTLVRAIKPLQRDRLLKSSAGADDPRQLVFSLAEAGERTIAQAMPLWAKAQEELENKLGTREAARLRSSLLALAEAAE